MDEISAFVLKFDDKSDYAGKYVQLDRSSGGYPVAATNLFYASRWQTEEEALQYAEMFQRDGSLSNRAIEQKAYVLTASVGVPMLNDVCNGRSNIGPPNPFVKPHPKCPIRGNHAAHTITVPRD